MGCTTSTPAQLESQRLDDELELSNGLNSVKILLLGAGECGKSTILKQMQILHSGGFDVETRHGYRVIIYSNILDTVVLIAQHVHDHSEPHLKLAIAQLSGLKVRKFTDDLIPAILLLCGTEQVVNMLRDRSQELQLIDSGFGLDGAMLLSESSYFLSMPTLIRILEFGYVPSDQDILRSRVATTGIHTTSFTVGPNIFNMYDVGGQRGERRKWINCFDSVTSIMFLASLNEYDQVLVEDNTRNRMQESLTIFECICKLSFIQKGVSMILFLNKHDLFEEKAVRVDLGSFFPSYMDGLNAECAREFIALQYQMRYNAQVPKEHVYTHYTTATSTRNVEFVWQSTKNIILRQSLRNSSLDID